MRNTGFVAHPARRVVAKFRCPRCGALPREPCLRKNGQPRKSNHLERVKAAERFIDAKPVEERFPTPPADTEDYLLGGYWPAVQQLAQALREGDMEAVRRLEELVDRIVERDERNSLAA